VDDIVSETFLVVWRRLDDVPESPLPWLLAVALGEARERAQDAGEPRPEEPASARHDHASTGTPA
jgi:RNA polymerase sigma-70 factor, ECF subfamily